MIRPNTYHAYRTQPGGVSDDELEEISRTQHLSALELLGELGIFSKTELEKITKPKVILIIDDSAQTRQLVSKYLANLGYNFLEASQGEEGLARMRQNKDIALVFCDVTMPVIDGMKLLEEAKLDPYLSKIPIVMLTSVTEKNLVIQSKRFGARGWIIKPPTLSMLQKYIDILVEKTLR